MNNFYQLSSIFLNVIKTTKNLSDKTIIAYNSDLMDFCNFLSINGLHNNIILNYVVHLFDERHLQESTITRKLVVIKMFLQFLYQNGYVEQNYYQNYTFKLKKERKLPKTLSVDESSKLIKYLSDNINRNTSKFTYWKACRDLALIDLLISSGIRIEEASNISLDDVILSEQTILIHGKGRKQRFIYISCTDTWDNLMNWLKIRSEQKNNTDKIFVNRLHIAIIGSNPIFDI